jgi:hypothetical protein
MTSTTCRENKARTEVPEECCENGGLRSGLCYDSTGRKNMKVILVFMVLLSSACLRRITPAKLSVLLVVALQTKNLR